jgi:uncharacterized protein YkwD
MTCAKDAVLILDGGALMYAANLGIWLIAAAALPSCGWADESVNSVVDALLAAHNRERAREHIAPLKLSRALCESAAVHVRDMAEHQKLDHKGSDGSTVAERAKKCGYAFGRVGENIANGQKSVEKVMDAWMNSQGHRANILADYTEMGAAQAEDENGDLYWCVNFGIPIPRLDPKEAAAAVLKRINEDRKAQSRQALKADPALGRGAMAISAAMASKDSLEIGGDPFKLIGVKEIEGKDIRLQLSANVPTPEAAAKTLVGADSDPLATFREVGIGYAVAKSGTPYWSAIFAKPVEDKKNPRAGQP